MVPVPKVLETFITGTITDESQASEVTVNGQVAAGSHKVVADLLRKH